jgi:hypothetical protein
MIQNHVRARPEFPEFFDSLPSGLEAVRSGEQLQASVVPHLGDGKQGLHPTFIPHGPAAQGRDKSGRLSHRPGSRLRAVSNKATTSSLPSVEGIFIRGKSGSNTHKTLFVDGS